MGILWRVRLRYLSKYCQKGIWLHSLRRGTAFGDIQSSPSLLTSMFSVVLLRPKFPPKLGGISRGRRKLGTLGRAQKSVKKEFWILIAPTLSSSKACNLIRKCGW